MDWEAILAQHPDQFITSLSPWLYPAQAKGEEASPAATPTAFPGVDTLPEVSQMLATVRQRLVALNGQEQRYV